MLDALDLLRTQARANHLANRRLHAVMAALSEAEFQAPRVGFFPSLALTLNHVLAIDIYYLDALEGRAGEMEANYQAFRPSQTLAELALRQSESDARLIAFCEGLRPADALRAIRLDRVREIQQAPLAHVLQHLMMHQTHHRGQAHAMLNSTALKPPQLDEFLLPSDAQLHRADLAALGWCPEQLFPGLG